MKDIINKNPITIGIQVLIILLLLYIGISGLNGHTTLGKVIMLFTLLLCAGIGLRGFMATDEEKRYLFYCVHLLFLSPTISSDKISLILAGMTIVFLHFDLEKLSKESVDKK